MKWHSGHYPPSLASSLRCWGRVFLRFVAAPPWKRASTSSPSLWAWFVNYIVSASTSKAIIVRFFLGEKHLEREAVVVKMKSRKSNKSPVYGSNNSVYTVEIVAPLASINYAAVKKIDIDFLHDHDSPFILRKYIRESKKINKLLRLETQRDREKPFFCSSFSLDVAICSGMVQLLLILGLCQSFMIDENSFTLKQKYLIKILIRNKFFLLNR